MRDVEVEGYTIEKGTLFIANLAKFMKDPKCFPNPEAFMPERFIDSNYGDGVNSKIKLKVLRGGKSIILFGNHCMAFIMLLKFYSFYLSQVPCRDK